MFQAAYFEDVCYNVISEVGFGPGPLKRSHLAGVREGVPYFIPGQDFTSGIPGIPSMIIDYHNPGSQLTFHWFKHNIICQDHPSVCGHQHSPRRKERTKEMKKMCRSKGGKKARRKKNQVINEQNMRDQNMRENNMLRI